MGLSRQALGFDAGCEKLLLALGGFGRGGLFCQLLAVLALYPSCALACLENAVRNLPAGALEGLNRASVSDLGHQAAPAAMCAAKSCWLTKLAPS